MKTIRLLFLIIVAAAVCQSVASTQTAPPRNNGLAVREETFPNGQLKARWVERLNADGTATKHGLAEYYYDNGQMKSKVQYVEGKENGIGLGLTIVKKILDEHHATIDIHSAITKGTTVHISLPLAEHLRNGKEPGAKITTESL